MNSIKLSLIIAVYQVEKYIEKCIRSLLVDGCFTYELLIIDDGTKDRSIDIIREKFDDKRIRIIHQANKGLSAARNLGIHEARGEYVWCFDSDDWADTHRLVDVLNMLDGNVDVLCFKSHYMNYEETNREEVIEDSVYGDCGFELACSEIEPCAQYFCYRRALLIGNSLFFKEGILHEDSLFTPITLAYCKSVAYFEKPVYHHFIRGGSITQVVKPKRFSDLITVTQNLVAFGDALPMKERYRWGRCITSVIYGILQLEGKSNDSAVIKQVEGYLNRNSKLIKYFLNSNALKNKIFAFVVIVLMGNMTLAYKVLSWLKK